MLTNANSSALFQLCFYMFKIAVDNHTPFVSGIIPAWPRSSFSYKDFNLIRAIAYIKNNMLISVTS